MCHGLGVQVLQQDAEFDALQWFDSVRHHYTAERLSTKKAAEQAALASAERTGIGQWLSGLVLGEGKVFFSILLRTTVCVSYCSNLGSVSS